MSLGQCWSVPLKFSQFCPRKNRPPATRAKKRKVVPKLYEPIKRGEGNVWCDEWYPSEVRGHSYLYNSLRVRRHIHLTEADLDNLCMRDNKSKILLLLVRRRWSLYQNWTSRKEESNAIIISIIWVVLRWNLALVANFNKLRLAPVNWQKELIVLVWTAIRTFPPYIHWKSIKAREGWRHKVDDSLLMV